MTKFEHKDDPVHFVVFFELMLWVMIRVMVLNITFNNMAVISWRYIGGGKRSIRRKPPTCR